MENTIIELTPETINNYSLCGYKDPKKNSFQKKAEWLKRNFSDGLKYKVFSSGGESFGNIEYIPGEHAWRPVQAEGYMFIQCISIEKKKMREQGLGWALVKSCIDDARKNNMKGVAVVTRKGSWMVGNKLFLKHGFEIADTAPPDFELLALQFGNHDLPGFKIDMEDNAKKYGNGLVILYSDQCPYISKFLEDIEKSKTVENFGLKAKLIEITDASLAQDSPSPFGIFAILYNGKVLTTNPISNTRFKNILNSELK